MKTNADNLATSFQLSSNCITGKKRPQDQTNEEWLADHNSADSYRTAKWGEPASTPNIDRNNASTHFSPKPPESVADINQSSSATQQHFKYIDHRTTRPGSVAMDFESLDGKITATAFFNVDITSIRGTKYPTGKRGQFIPPVQGKFRKLWMQAVGEAPTRWSRVHKFMRSQFRELVFTGKITCELDSKGNHYFKLRNVELRN